MEQNESSHRRSSRVPAVNYLYAQGIQELKNSTNNQRKNKKKSKNQRIRKNVRFSPNCSLDPDQKQYPAIINKDDTTKKIMITVVPPKKKTIQKSFSSKFNHQKSEQHQQHQKANEQAVNHQVKQNKIIQQHTSSRLLDLLWTQINKVANLPEKKQQMTESQIPIDRKENDKTQENIQQVKISHKKKLNQKRRPKKFTLRKYDR